MEGKEGIVVINTKAMTVPELLIVVVLIMVIVGAAITPYIIQQDLLKKQLSRNRLQDDISVALAYLEKDIYVSSEIYRSDGTTALAVGTPVNDVSIGIDTSLAPPADVFFVYALNGTDLQRNGSTIAENITTFEITQEAGNLISMAITGTDVNTNESIALVSAIAVRALAAA